MRVLVGVKRVVDYAAKVRVLADKTGVDLNSVRMSMNPFCEIAVEQAVKLKESKVATEVVAVSIGPKACTETLRTALAMGADKGIHVVADVKTDQDLQPLAIAKIMAHLAKQEKVDIVLVGKQAIDSDNCATGPMLAGLLGWSQCTFAAKLDVDAASKTIAAERETDTGTEQIKLKLPTVITADLRLNTPRYATLQNIMKAKKKPIATVAVADAGGADITPKNKVVSVEEPAARKAGQFVENVDELISKLKNEAGVI